MSKTEYWALVRAMSYDESRVRTLLRRRHTPRGTIDEILRVDGEWHATGILVLADLNMYENPLRPLSAADAEILERRLLALRPDDQDRGA